MNERITFCGRCSAMIPWGRLLCDGCLAVEVARQRGDAGPPAAGPPRRECRSCYSLVDDRAQVCPHCGQDPHAEFWYADGARRQSRVGPWIAAAYLFVVLPLFSWLVFVLLW